MKIFSCENLKQAVSVTVFAFAAGIALQIMMPAILAILPKGGVYDFLPAFLWYVGFLLLGGGMLGFLTTLIMLFIPGKSDVFETCA